MYISSCSIRSWNWNRKLTQDHFLIEHWIQRTHRCPAVRCWPWVYSLGMVSRYSTVRSGTLTWREWGLWPWLLSAAQSSVGWCHLSMATSSTLRATYILGKQRAKSTPESGIFPPVMLPYWLPEQITLNIRDLISVRMSLPKLLTTLLGSVRETL